MWPRKFHRYLGLILSPLILVTAVTGGILLWRKHFHPDLKHDLLDWHNWEIVASYAGVVVAGGLVLMVFSGVAMWAQMAIRKRRAKSK
jgi:uncharacterized iron-regulated membrane protein